MLIDRAAETLAIPGRGGTGPAASSELLPLVYEELRQLAALRMREETPGQTLQATALVHEAYLRLLDADPIGSWNSRGHFFAAAAESMRRILVERARRKSSLKRGGGHCLTQLSDVSQPECLPMLEMLALDEALHKLEKMDPRKAELVKLRYFTGLTISEAAEILGIAASTADRDWAYARCWLRLEMQGETSS